VDYENSIIEGLSKEKKHKDERKERRELLLNDMRREIKKFKRFCVKNNISIGRFTSNLRTINLGRFRDPQWSLSGWHVNVYSYHIHQGDLHTNQSTTASYSCPERIIKKVTYGWLLKRINKYING
jgi:hypothetical protein